VFFFEVDAFSAARAFFFMTRGSPFSVTRSLRVRLRFPSMGSLKVLEEDMVVGWMDSDGWTEEMLDDKGFYICFCCCTVLDRQRTLISVAHSTRT
jgi:hypothetical protein